MDKKTDNGWRLFDSTPQRINFCDVLIVDENGVEYKGERIEDAGKVYEALCQMLSGYMRQEEE